MGGNNGQATAAAAVREQARGWWYLLPNDDDAVAFGQLTGRLDLDFGSYDLLGGKRGAVRRFILIAKDTEEGERRARRLAKQSKLAKSHVRVWRLTSYGSDECPNLRAWAKTYRFEVRLGLDKPWEAHAEAAEPGEQAKPPAAPPETHGESLLRLTQEAEVFHTPEGDACVTLTLNGKREHHAVPSAAVERWLVHAFWRESGKVPAAESLINAQKVLASRAHFEGPEVPLALRVGAEPGSRVVYVDLANEAREVVRIVPGSWEVVHDVPVRFRRPRGTAPLPVPVRGGEVAELFDFLNVIDEPDQLLVVAALTHDFLPWGPYPVKVITGEQGSAKSTCTRLLKRCVDPRSPVLGCTPKDPRDLMVIAKSTWVLSFDNLSSLPGWFSDALARLSTGGGFSTRKLHTDDEETFFESVRPVVINSIEEIANRADLLDRAVVITCPVIPDVLRREEREFWAAFEAAYPRILGALLDAVAGGLATLPEVELESAPRMADFARWGEAVCRFLGHPEGAFLEAYVGNRDGSAAAVIEDSAVAAELQGLRLAGEIWRGTCQELLDQLREQAAPSHRDSPSWPKGPRSLSTQLRRLAPALRKVGVDVVFPKRDRNRTFTIIFSESEVGGGPSE